MARPDDVKFREASEVLGEAEGNEGNFADGLWIQEVINAVEISHHERRWVDLPLEDGQRGEGQPGGGQAEDGR